jgi:hypothetical protein
MKNLIFFTLSFLTIPCVGQDIEVHFFDKKTALSINEAEGLGNTQWAEAVLVFDFKEICILETNKEYCWQKRHYNITEIMEGIEIFYYDDYIPPGYELRIVKKEGNPISASIYVNGDIFCIYDKYMPAELADR